ncbi:GNAT family N-acetyltransferase [Streptomyces sp. NPDC006012]|uniref:GNAT family N-acetyltransferase n=1 Tax=Streptomyces sp. NPDC006012 TaxID=3364739 RepID=UPI00369F7546
MRTADTESYALEVYPARLRSGVGRTLLAQSVEQCAVAGHPRMPLCVLKENVTARRCYERCGFRADGAAEPFDVDGMPVPGVRYARTPTG